MAIEQDMEIFDRFDILRDINAFQIDQLDCGQQNFGTVKHPLCNRRAHEKAVLARHQKILRGQALAQGTGTDTHGPQLWVDGIRRADDLAAVVAFFEARNGRLLRLPVQGLGRPQVLPALGQRHRPPTRRSAPATATTTAFQLVKRYASGRAIVDARSSPSRCGHRAHRARRCEQPSGWSVDTATGVVTFSAAPGSGVAITAGFAFDVPVRFDTDALDVTLDLERLGSITSIPLLEIRR